MFDASCFAPLVEESLQAARGDCGLGGRGFCQEVVAGLAIGKTNRPVGLPLPLQDYGVCQVMKQMLVLHEPGRD